MNNFVSTLWQAIGITFLIILALFMFSVLIEYVRFLWMRHKTKKTLKKIFNENNKELISPIDENIERLRKAIEEQIGEEVDNVKVVKFDKKKKKKE